MLQTFTAQIFVLVTIADIRLFFIFVLPWLLNAQPTFMTRNSMICSHTSTFFGVTLTTFWGDFGPGQSHPWLKTVAKMYMVYSFSSLLV